MPDSTSVNTRHYLTYMAMLLVFGAGIWLILAFGSRQHPQTARTPATVEAASPANSATGAGIVPSFVGRIFRENLRTSLSILLLQMLVIIIAARSFGSLFRHLGQPRVMGEIVAGLILGPSVLGLLSPGAMGFLFPPASLEPLRLLSQIGVALFMFVVSK